MKEFLDFLKTFLFALCRFLYLILFKLYLMLPLTALFIILIASAAAGFRLSDYSGYIAIILVLCTALSVLLFLRGLFLPKKDNDAKKEIRSLISKPKTLAPKKETEIEETGNDESDIIDEHRTPKKSRLFSADIKGRTFDSPKKETSEFKQDAAVPDKYEGSEDVEPETVQEQLMMFEPPKKTEPPKPVYPRYLRTKRDPNIVLVEYEDRLEIYRKTINGIQYIETEYKPSPSF